MHWNICIQFAVKYRHIPTNTYQYIPIHINYKPHCHNVCLEVQVNIHWKSISVHLNTCKYTPEYTKNTHQYASSEWKSEGGIEILYKLIHF